ncbi:MAG: M15 family peptidase [Candidatus Binatia bacterium]
MPKFSAASIRKLDTLHPDLCRVLLAAITHIDFTIIYGYRGEEEQETAFNLGNSKVHFPDSKHNVMPSLAVDIAPWPVDWKDHKRFLFYAGYIVGLGRGMGVELVSGADWDGDGDLSDQRFNDLGHVQLK